MGGVNGWKNERWEGGKVDGWRWTGGGAQWGANSPHAPPQLCSWK